MRTMRVRKFPLLRTLGAALASASLLANVATGAAAQSPAASIKPGDPLQSPACLGALKSLQERENAQRAGSPSLTALSAARRQAAIACLGQADAPMPQHLAQPPLRVAPVIVPPMPAAARMPPTSPPPPAVTPMPMPPMVTSCDAAGCWASDGTRLQRNGPDLVGPRGLCSVDGGVLRCP